MTQNFQDMILGVYQVHPWRQGWPCLPSLLSESSTSSKYPHEGPSILDTLIIKTSTWKFQGIFLRVKQCHPLHHGWPCHPSLLSKTLNVLQIPPWRTPPILDTLLIKILTKNCQGIFLAFKHGNPWHQRWPCHPSILSGTVYILQVPPWRTPHSWHTLNKDINT